MEKMFVHIAKAATFTEALKKLYKDSIVFIAETGEIWTHEKKYSSMAELSEIDVDGSITEALKKLTYFKTVTGNSGSGSAQVPDSVLNIKGDGTIITTSVSDTGVTITGKDWSGDIADAKKAGTDAATAAQNAKNAADGKVAAVTGTGAIDVTEGTNPEVSLKLAATQGDKVTVTQGTAGLKVEVDLSDYATTDSINYPVTSVGADVASAITVDPTTGDVKVALSLDTSGNVTLSQSASGLKAAIDLSNYATKEDVSSLKDVFVKEGSVVKGTFAEGGSFTESAQGTDTALKLVLENQTAPIYINVADLVDVYDGSKLFLNTISTEATYTAPVSGQSVDKAISLLIKGVADAKAAADEAAKNAGVTKFGDKVGEITVKGNSTTNGVVNFTMNNNELNGSVYGLKSAAYTDADAYATAEQGALADSAVQSVTVTNGTYVTASVTGTTAKTITINDSAIEDLFKWEEL